VRDFSDYRRFRLRDDPKRLFAARSLLHHGCFSLPKIPEHLVAEFTSRSGTPLVVESSRKLDSTPDVKVPTVVHKLPYKARILLGGSGFWRPVRNPESTSKPGYWRCQGGIMYFCQSKAPRLPILRASLSAGMLLLLCACAVMDQHVATPPTTASPQTSSEPPASSPASAGQPVTVNLTEWKIEMPNSLPAGATTLKITNAGKETHNLKIQGNGLQKALSKNLKPGESGELQVDLKPGTYKVYCPVGAGPTSHDSKGMAFQLVVTELK
jgi:uncharacterized cupredoxin-like copper-binding protein